MVAVGAAHVMLMLGYDVFSGHVFLDDCIMGMSPNDDFV